MWGGLFNPIIPVFQVGPKEWRKEKWRTGTKGRNVAKGYIEFFEPDAFIEAESGLAAEVGLEHLERKYVSHSRVMPLDALLRKREPRDFAELAMGLTVSDVARDLYRTERRFQLRDEVPAYLVKPDRSVATIEAKKRGSLRSLLRGDESLMTTAATRTLFF
jgi:hypothetical protein